jgi:TonB family protein
VSKRNLCRTLNAAALALCLLALSPAGLRSQDKQAQAQKEETQHTGAGGPGGTQPAQGPDVTSGTSQAGARRAVIEKRPEPGTTAEARANHTGGVVRLRAILSASGKVTHIEVLQGLPNGLTKKAIEAAKKIKFTPAEKDGHPVSQYVVIEYNFDIY